MLIDVFVFVIGIKLISINFCCVFDEVWIVRFYGWIQINVHYNEYVIHKALLLTTTDRMVLKYKEARDLSGVKQTYIPSLLLNVQSINKFWLAHNYI